MRISLTTKITIALVLFGLVPASIVAWFAYDSNNDFGKLRPSSSSRRQRRSATACRTADGSPSRPEGGRHGTNSRTTTREKIKLKLIHPRAIRHRSRPGSSCLTPNDKVLVKRSPTGLRPNLVNCELSARYLKRWRKMPSTTAGSGPSSIESEPDQSRDHRLRSRAPERSLKGPKGGMVLSPWSRSPTMSPTRPSTRTSCGPS